MAIEVPQRIGARSIADAIGITGSTLCALHCLIVPITLVLGPIAPLMAFEDESVHRALVWLVLPTAIIAFATGCAQHRDRRVAFLGATGLALLLSSFTLLHDLLGENGERIAALAAAALLISAHVRNSRLCRASDCDDGCGDER